jgi:hypothetical protein
MTNEEKLNICYDCPHYFNDDSNEEYDGTPNTASCKLKWNTLIRGFILSDCPDGRWNNVN